MSNNAESLLGVETEAAPPPKTPGPAPDTSNPLYGVHGWLKFWVVVRIYLDPIFTALMLIVAWIGFVALAEKHGGSIIVSGFIETAVAVFLTVMGIQVGIGLRDIKPRAVQATKRWLLLVLGWAFISPLASLALGFPKELLGPETIKGIAKGLIQFGIWYSYFNVSKRVKATYPDWGKHTLMLRLPFELFLALRYLRPKRTFISVITLLSVIGVMIGVAVLIIVISVMSGFDKQLRDKILGFNAHLRIMKWDSGSSGWPSPMSGWPALMGVVEKSPDVQSVAPFVMGQVMIKTQPKEGHPMVGAPYVRGIDVESETNLTMLVTNIVGEFDLTGRSILVGSEFASAMHLHLGDRLSVYSPSMLEKMEQQRGKEGEEAILPEEFVIKGIFDVGYYEYNANFIITSLENAQNLYDLDDSVHGLVVVLKDPYQVENVREFLRRELGGNYRITTWMQENSSILNALIVEKKLMFFLLFFITIVAVFGIVISMITFVMKKTREIGVMKALGAANYQVLWLFLSQSLVVGVLGVAIGFGLGMLALEYRNPFLHVMNQLTGLDLFPPQIYSFTDLPALIDPWDILKICGSALGFCLLGGLIPAWAAILLKPVQALRHE